MYSYRLISTGYNGQKEYFALEAENIVDIQDALKIASKYTELATKYPKVWRKIYGELPPHCRECMPDTILRMSKVSVPTFNY